MNVLFKIACPAFFQSFKENRFDQGRYKLVVVTLNICRVDRALEVKTLIDGSCLQIKVPFAKC